MAASGRTGSLGKRLAAFASVSLTLALLAPSDSAVAGYLKLFIPAPPNAAALGSYQGNTRIELGEVLDDGFVETANTLGALDTANGGSFIIETEEPRVETVRGAIQDLLRETGLLAATPAVATHAVDVIIRRYRIASVIAGPRDTRVRTELFLELRFRQGGSAAGRVLVCGNAETHFKGINLNKMVKKCAATHQAAFDDARHKIVTSQTFRDLVSEGWSPGSGDRWQHEKFELSRIDRTVFYGPSIEAEAEIDLLRDVLAPVHHGPLFLADFEIKDPDMLEYLEEIAKDPDDREEDDDARVALAWRWTPELTWEYLAAFYPGAFPDINREWDKQPGIAVTGEVLLFDIKGAKNKLKADVHFRNAHSGEILYTVHVYWIRGSANMGWSFLAGVIEARVDAGKLEDASASASKSETSWVGNFVPGALRLMEDELAKNLAFLLVRSLVPEYRYPADLEVVFDDLPYPPPPAVADTSSDGGTP